MSNEDAITSRIIIEHLKRRYSDVQWFFQTEFHVDGRRLDAFAMDCFASHRFERIAFEIKVSRRDFTMEMDHPEKRLPAEQIANRCYFVTPQGLVTKDEIPEGWGLMEVNKAGLRKAKNAQWRDIEPLSMAHIANLLLRHPEKSERPVGDMDFWKVAGQSMSLEDFEAMVQTRFEERARPLRLEAVAEFRQSEEQMMTEIKASTFSDLCGYGHDSPEKVFIITRDRASLIHEIRRLLGDECLNPIVFRKIVEGLLSDGGKQNIVRHQEFSHVANQLERVLRNMNRLLNRDDKDQGNE